MPYPQHASASTNFALEAQRGNAVDGTKLAVELARINSILNEVRAFLQAVTTADKKWKPSTAVTMQLVEAFDYVATASQTSFLFTGGITANTSTDKAVVFSGSTVLPQSSVTLTTTGVTIPAQTVGTAVKVLLYNDAASLATNLASTANGDGASLIGIEDVQGNFTAATVEDALAELYANFNDLQADIADSTTLIRADGSVAFAANQSVGGFRLTNLADGIASTDAATVAQVNAVNNTYAALGSLYLAIDGSNAMSANLAMGNNRITGLAAGTQPTDAVNKSQIDSIETDVLATAETRYIRSDGTTTITTAIPFGNQRLALVGTGTVGTDAVNKDQMDAAIAAALPDTGDLSGDLGGAGFDSFSSFGNGGRYNYSSLTMSSGQSTTLPLYVSADGAIVISSDLTKTASVKFETNSTYTQSGNILGSGSVAFPSGADVTIRAKGNISITGSIDAGTLVIVGGGTVSISGAVNASQAYIKAAGAVTISSTITAQHLSVTERDGQDWGSTEGAGGGAGGAGGRGGDGDSNSDSGGTSVYANAFNALLDTRARELGGLGGEDGVLSQYARGGGIVVIYAGAACTMTGGAIAANGNAGSSSDVSRGAGGGGGGTVLVAANGTLTDCSATANGGAGENETYDGGGGGGGHVIAVATAFAGTTTLAANRGANGSGSTGTQSVDGTTKQLTLTAAQVTQLEEDGVFDPP